uniref:Uncharacterized protein n=1 Tax=Meloidogyne hapla TaxID=6305 RepID=A0A1I8AX40_MELHA
MFPIPRLSNDILYLIAEKLLFNNTQIQKHRYVDFCEPNAYTLFMKLKWFQEERTSMNHKLFTLGKPYVHKSGMRNQRSGNKIGRYEINVRKANPIPIIARKIEFTDSVGRKHYCLFRTNIR